jgi:hypothetical protein
MIPKNFIFQKCNMGIQNVEFDADFESVEKVAKRLMQKNT